jgi:hypothetical protein
MSQQATETRAQRRSRERHEGEAPDQPTTETPETPETPDPEQQAEGEAPDQPTTETPETPETPDPEQQAEAEAIAAVEGFALAESDELRTATAPVRNRKAVQKAMDAVARKAYRDWIEAGRPSTWSRLPVITYFLDPEEVSDYRKMIRAAVGILQAESYEKDGKTVEPSGVRARFGGDFVLDEKMAAKIGRPEQAGKTVLAWAAIDKRLVSSNANGGDE